MPSGTQVQFTLRPPRAESYSHASVSARFESWGDQIVLMKMPWQGRQRNPGCGSPPGHWGGVREIRPSSDGYQDFICAGEDSVVRRWLRAGADGWRLDVADELPDDQKRSRAAAFSKARPRHRCLGDSRN